jgi:hypothetical protein
VTVIELILEKINERLADVQEDLGSGVAKDYADYRYICGILHGMLAVKRYVDDIKTNLEND